MPHPAAVAFFSKLAAGAPPAGGGGRFGWVGPAASAAVGGTLGYNLNDDPNDPNAKWIGTLFGGAGGALGNLAGKGKSPSARIGITSGTILGADLLGPRVLNTMRAVTSNANAQTALANAQREQLAKPVPEATAAPGTEVKVQDSPSETVGLSPATMLGIGALGAGGIWLYSKLMEKNRPQVNVNTATTSAAADNAAAPSAPGAGGAAASLGTLRVTLPTKRPTDNETVVEMPLEQIRLPNTILNKLRRDTKRRLRSEGSERTIRMNPEAKVADLAALAHGMVDPFSNPTREFQRHSVALNDLGDKSRAHSWRPSQGFFPASTVL